MIRFHFNFSHDIMKCAVHVKCTCTCRCTCTLTLHVHVSSVFLDNTAVRLKVYSRFLRSRQDLHKWILLTGICQTTWWYIHRHHNNAQGTAIAEHSTATSAHVQWVKMIWFVSVCRHHFIATASVNIAMQISQRLGWIKITICNQALGL